MNQNSNPFGLTRSASVAVVLVLACAALCTGEARSLTPVSASGAAESARWLAPVPLFRGAGPLVSSVSCPTARSCVAVGSTNGVGVDVTGATTWSPPVTLDQGGGLAGVSCWFTRRCVAVGASAYPGPVGATFHLGPTWRAGSRTTTALDSVSCPGPTFCGAVDAGTPGHGYVFDGRGWKSTTLKTSATSVSCPKAGWCAIVSLSGQVTYYEFDKWSRPVSVDARDPLTDISCASLEFCVAVDANGAALVYRSGWSQPRVVDASSSLTAVSCPTTKFCVAVDSSGDAFSYNGSNWSSPQPSSPALVFTAVSCPTTKFCVAVGDNTTATTAYAAIYERSP